MEHQYPIMLDWTGNTGKGTLDYKDYERSFQIQLKDKAVLYGSSDPAFRGDPTKYNPEEMLVMSLSSCHMLWYLHLCAISNVVVLGYRDKAKGFMEETTDGGHFSKVELHPEVSVMKATMIDAAIALHEKAHRFCFIANSVNFPVECHPAINCR